MDPFQIVRMCTRNCRGTREVRLPPKVPFPEYDALVTTVSPSATPSSDALLPTRTAPALWRYVLDQGFAAPAYLEENGDEWREVSWQDAGERVEALAHALLAHGVGRGDAVAVIARTRLEWVLLDWAVMRIGAVVVGIYPTSTAKESAYILAHSESVLAFAEDDAQREKLASVQAEAPALRELFRFDELPALEAEGRAHAVAQPGALDDAAREIQEEDVATLIYTSGTTGPPKACMLTHRNLVTAALRVRTNLKDGGDVVLLFLPLAHTFGRLAHQAAAYYGSTVAFVADPARIAEALGVVRPTVLPAVPRIYEKIHAGVLDQIESAGGAKRSLGLWGIDVGARASRLQRAGRPVPPLLALQQRIADRLVFAKVRQKLGGRLRIGVSGAAPLGTDVLEFFHALGMLVVEGYGLTETASSLSVNDPDAFRFGTVGRAIEGTEIKFESDGEILVRSDTVFSGYYKDPEATAAAFTADGWFRTGDVGEIDAEGFLKITDRKKDLIITAGGKNIAPQNLENALKASRFVSQALVVGDRRPYIVALITIDHAEVEASGRDPRELVQGIVDGVNRDRVRVEQIKRFAILPRDFTQEDGEVTPTLKVRRKIVHEHFAETIDELYR
ncbi:MAG: AMP-dependent synthetase and ligase [Actinomycetia bacterium]|nr:AMP-dependent synthetase and ligase [Actinomycetes bacterium]